MVHYLALWSYWALQFSIGSALRTSLISSSVFHLWNFTNQDKQNLSVFHAFGLAPIQSGSNSKAKAELMLTLCWGRILRFFVFQKRKKNLCSAKWSDFVCHLMGCNNLFPSNWYQLKWVICQNYKSLIQDGEEWNEWKSWIERKVNSCTGKTSVIVLMQTLTNDT